MQVAEMPDASPPPAAGDIVLRTVGLTKRFGRRAAVDRLDLQVPRGRVFGFLGPNGSGKTTTIGMVLGLIAPNEGHVELFGLDARTHRAAALRRVGATLEGQAYYPHLSARDNLRLLALVSGGLPDTRVDEVLERVQLASRARDKVRTYSLGMKQRLQVGAALLHDPDLIVLDEPTNGLDPAGVREFREMVRALAATGKTVFVSSHLLGEVQLMCDDVGILKEGRLLTQGPVAQLVAGGGSGLEVRTTDTPAAIAVLRPLPWVAAVTADGELLAVDAPAERAADISRALAEAGIYLRELRPRENSLEDVFLEITGEAQP